MKTKPKKAIKKVAKVTVKYKKVKSAKGKTYYKAVRKPEIKSFVRSKKSKVNSYKEHNDLITKFVNQFKALNVKAKELKSELAKIEKQQSEINHFISNLVF